MKKVICLLGMSIVLLSCSMNDNNVEKSNSSKIEQSLTEERIVNASVEAVIYNVPDGVDSEEVLYEYLQTNVSSIDADYSIFIDEELVVSERIREGIVENKLNENPLMALGGRDCGYESTRQCAVGRIDSKSTMGKIICSFKGIKCVLKEMAHCLADCLLLEEYQGNWPDFGDVVLHEEVIFERRYIVEEGVEALVLKNVSTFRISNEIIEQKFDE